MKQTKKSDRTFTHAVFGQVRSKLPFLDPVLSNNMLFILNHYSRWKKFYSSFFSPLHRVGLLVIIPIFL